MVAGHVKFVVFAMVLASVMGGLEGTDLCNMNEDGLMACKPSVTKPDPVDPTTECCGALVGADLACLCSYRNSYVLPALGIDPDLAMALPSKCSLTTPADC